MRVRVNFRVNTDTGEVEEFLIEDISTEPEPHHDAVHDRIAREVGQVVERRASPEQVIPGAGADAPSLILRLDDELPAADEREEATE